MITQLALMPEVSWSVLEPRWLWLLALLGPLVAMGWWWLRGMDIGRRCVVVGLRVLLIGVLVVLLAGLLWQRSVDDLRVVVLMDRSESALRFFTPPGDDPADRLPAETDGAGYIRWFTGLLEDAAQAKPADDRLGLVAFAGSASVLSLPSLDGVGEFNPNVSLDRGTDPSSAIRRGLTLMTPDSGGRMVLLWDGRATVDAASIEEAAAAAASQGVRIDVVPLEYRRQREVMVHRLVAPTTSVAGRSVWVRTVLRATEPVTGHLRLLHDGVPVRVAGEGDDALGVRVEVEDWAGSMEGGEAIWTAVVNVPVTLYEPGLHRYEAIFTPLGAEDVPVWSAHRRTGYTLAQGRGRILVIHSGERREIDPLARAVHRAGVEVDVRPVSGLPGSLRVLRSYDLVILSNTPSDGISTSQQRALMLYVQDIGGGMIVIGGDRSFGAGGWTGAPLADVFPVDTQIPDMTILPPAALSLVIDKSGSMGMIVPGTRQTQQTVANEASILALETLLPQDFLQVVAFDHQTDVIVPMGPNRDPVRTERLIRGIRPGGGTAIGLGMEVAWQAMERLPEDVAVKHMIVLTDGVSMVPPGGWEDLIKRVADSGITVSTIGVGGEVDHMLLENIARETGGIYHFVRDPRQLPQVFMRESRTIRRTLVRDAEFRPRPADRSPLTEGLGEIPPLGGLVLTGVRDDPRVVNAWMGPDDAPVLAYWQVGLGRVAAFTSDATARWATNWLEWAGFESFWRNLVDTVARPSAESMLELNTSLRGRSLHVRLEHFPEEDQAPVGRSMTAQASVVLPDGQISPMTLEQTGPGIFEGRMDAPDDGDYLVSASVQSGDGAYRGMTFGVAARRPDAELEHFTSNRAAVERIARVTGGRVLEAGDLNAEEWFSRDGFEPVLARRLVQWSLLVAALMLFWLDVASRRIAWSGTGVIERLRSGFARRGQEEGEVGRTLVRLRDRAATGYIRPRGDGQDEDGQDMDRAAAMVDARRAKAEAARQAGVTGVKLPGQEDPPPSDPFEPDPESGDMEPQGTADRAASRLLEAKRRARGRFRGRRPDKS
ncbi:MAG: VWA domain-containing protein [Phycisphaeraceae bacterium]|nr:VWA domain-containing protein [Phycisphaeraceae bacterium]